MQNSPNWTPSAEDNLLNLTDKDLINEQEAKGIALAELHVFSLETEVIISTNLFAVAGLVQAVAGCYHLQHVRGVVSPSNVLET